MNNIVTFTAFLAISVLGYMILSLNKASTVSLHVERGTLV